MGPVSFLMFVGHLINRKTSELFLHLCHSQWRLTACLVMLATSLIPRMEKVLPSDFSGNDLKPTSLQL